MGSPESEYNYLDGVPTTAAIRSYWAWSDGDLGGIDAEDPHEAELFDKWLERHDREVSAQALENFALLQTRLMDQHSYVMTEEDRSEVEAWVEALRISAERIREGKDQ